MKKIYFPILLIASLLFVGCESIPGWSYEVDSSNHNATLPGYRFLVRLADENTGADPALESSVLRRLQSELGFLGYEEVLDPNFASFLIFVSYGKSTANPNDYRHTFPSRDATGGLMFDEEPQDIPIVEPAEAMGSQKISHYLALTAYDVGDYRVSGRKSVVWDIRVKATGDSPDIRDVLYSMLYQALDEVEPAP